MAKKSTATASPRPHIDIGKQSRLAKLFSTFAQRTAAWTGHPTAFLMAVGVVVAWIVTGPLFNYSDTWQLVINTGTTIVTFLMVFLIQNTQNRDMLSMQLKLSELVLAIKGAEDEFASIEDLSEDELEALHNACRSRAQQTLEHLEKRREGDGKPRGGKSRKSAKA
ncbi:MAG: low affinity iron permease family protein [Pseudolabrys sp.]|nr:low affinity iron permease family protein [Pseudolabrys sp.]